MKNGWKLLIMSLITSTSGFLIFAIIGGQINTSTADIYAPIGAIIGFIAPSIIYFGNRT